jgi:hypothetical protein
MQILDDLSAEALIGGGRMHAPIRRRFTPNLNLTNIVAVVTQVAVPVSISIFGGNPRADVDQHVGLSLYRG